MTGFGAFRCSKSSILRELAAIDFSLESFAPILEDSLVKWFTDSQTEARIIEVGSMILYSHRFAIQKVFVWRCSGSHQLKMRRRITSPVAFSLEELWDPHTVDYLLIIIQQSSLDSFRVSGIRARQELTSLPKI